MPVFRPLIKRDKSEIVKVAYQIEPTISPSSPLRETAAPSFYAQASLHSSPSCTLWRGGEQAIDGEALLEEALQNLETEWVYPR